MNTQNKMTNKAKKLLGSDKPHLLWGDMGIRDNEHDGITHERLLEFIKFYPVKNISIGNNSYGEFQFISLEVVCYCNDGSPYNTMLQFWGNGYHEHRGVNIVKWNINVGNYFLIEDKSEMNKKEVIKQIKERRAAIGIKDNAKQEKSGNRFEMIAELTDDDAAMIYMEDYE